jgi:hypothetical protein
MPNVVPSPGSIWLAIDVYIKHAYDGPPPTAVQKRLDALHEQPTETFFECGVLERDQNSVPSRYNLRLGN